MPDAIVKPCGCGSQYTAAEWQALTRVGDGPSSLDGETWLDLRLCRDCHSTLAIEVPHTVCRRCTECLGEEHHWLTSIPEERVLDGVSEWVFICKHCDAVSRAIDCGVCDETIPQAVARPLGGHGALVCSECATGVAP